MKNGSSLVPYKKSAFSRASLFNEKDCFQLGISLHFWAFIVRYGFSASGGTTLLSTDSTQSVLDDVIA